MLPPATLHRLYQHVPQSIEVRWPDPRTDTTYAATVEPAVRWAGQDEDTPKPAIFLDRGPVAVERTADQPLSDVIYEETNTSDPTIALDRYKGARVYDVLTITVAVEESAPGTAVGTPAPGDPTTTTIPRSLVAHEVASVVWEEFRYRSDYLNVQGDDYEWPVLIRPATEGAIHAMGQSRDLQDDMQLPAEEGVERYQMQFYVKYTATTHVVVEAVSRLEGTFRIVDSDGDVLSTADWAADW